MDLHATIQKAGTKTLDFFLQSTEAKDIVYKHFQSTRFNSATRKNVDVFTNYPIRSMLQSHTNKTVQESSIPVEIGDKFFLTYYNGLGHLDLSQKDEIIDERGKVWSVKDIDRQNDLVLLLLVTGDNS